MRRGTKIRARWKLAVVAVLTALAVTLSVLAVLRTSGGVQPPSVYAVGDSITEADSPNFVAGQYGDGSWVSHLDPEITVVGGWARGGATTNDMVQHAIPGPGANTLVLLAGSNDVATRVPWEVTRANFEQIVETVAADSVFISAIPPRDEDPGSSVRFNQQLEALARERDWHFFDPTNEIRNGDRYAPGMSRDGIHPTPQAAEILGRNIGAEILAR